MSAGAPAAPSVHFTPKHGTVEIRHQPVRLVAFRDALSNRLTPRDISPAAH